MKVVTSVDKYQEKSQLRISHWLGCTLNLKDNHVGRLVSTVRKTLEEKRSLTMSKVVVKQGRMGYCHR